MDLTGRRQSKFWLRSILVLASLGASAAQAQSSKPTAWKLEQGTAMPSYAAVEPTTNLNIDMVVLACEQAQKGRVLQLQLYLSDDGPLRPIGLSPADLKDEPRARISIDAAEFPVALLFAGDHVVLADGMDGRFPRLSNRLLDALETGQSMILRFDLAAKQAGHPSDSKAMVDLRADGAREAIAAMRLCDGPTVPVGRLARPKIIAAD
jgi:hypothetical protein